MKDMKAGLAGYECDSLLGSMRWCLIHDNNQVTATMMPQHLRKEVDYLVRGDAFVMEPEDQSPTGRDGRHGRNATPFSRDPLFRRVAARSPSLGQQCRQRDVGFVLKIEDGVVFLHRPTNLRNLGAHPFLPLFLRQFKILPLGLLVSQPCLMQPTHHRLFREQHMKRRLNDLNESPSGPEVSLIPVVRRW